MSGKEIALSFLECLADKELKELYAQGQSFFVLSQDLNKIIWADHRSLKHLGYATIYEALGAPTNFSSNVHRQLAFGLNSGQIVQLDSQFSYNNFTLKTICLKNDIPAILVEYVGEQFFESSFENILKGLRKEPCEAAILTAQGGILVQTQGFDPFYVFVKNDIQRLTSRILLSKGAEVIPSFFQKTYDTSLGKRIVAYFPLTKSPKIFLIIISQSTYALKMFGIRKTSVKENSPTENSSPFKAYLQDKNDQWLRDNADFNPKAQASDSIMESVEKSRLNEKEKEAFKIIAASLDPIEAQDSSNSDRQVFDNLIPENFDSLRDIPKNKQNLGFSFPKTKRKEHFSTGEVRESSFIKDKCVIQDFENIFAQMDNALCIVNNAGIIQYANAKLGVLLGWHASALFGKKIVDYISKDYKHFFESFFTDLRSSLRTSKKSEIEMSDIAFMMQKKSGQSVEVFLDFIPLENLQGFSVILREEDAHVSETSLLLDSLINHPQKPQIEKIEAKEATQIAHELRTPLNAMLGYAQLIHSQRLGPIGNKLYLDPIKNILLSGEYMMALINSFLKSAKMKDMGHGTIEDRKLDAYQFSDKDIFLECIELMRGLAEEKNVSLKLLAASDLLPIKISSIIIQQIVLNLLSNAIRFTPAGGEVKLYVENSSKNMIRICVCDTGVGMNDMELKHALKPYGQNRKPLNLTENETINGSGLGLPIVKEIVEENGGKFSIVSHPNDGTIVSVILPICR